MKLIVGLGNPDKEYQNTFHNLGFMAVDSLADKLGLTFNKKKCKAAVIETKINDEKVIIAKPLTYMNLSGESVKELVDFYKINLKDLLVIFDDFDIKKGSVRIRERGSGGTHNGMKNIVKLLGSENFPRVRIGFHPEGEDVNIPLINLVLSGIKEQDRELFEKAIDRASDSAKDFINGKSIIEVMQKYNG